MSRICASRGKLGELLHIIGIFVLHLSCNVNCTLCKEHQSIGSDIREENNQGGRVNLFMLRYVEQLAFT